MRPGGKAGITVYLMATRVYWVGNAKTCRAAAAEEHEQEHEGAEGRSVVQPQSKILKLARCHDEAVPNSGEARSDRMVIQTHGAFGAYCFAQMNEPVAMHANAATTSTKLNMVMSNDDEHRTKPIPRQGSVFVGGQRALSPLLHS